MRVPRFDYEKFSSFFPSKKKWTLRPERALLKALKFKQKFKAIHIAGTNGKGSVAAFLDSILRAAKPKIKTGRYTSPHFERFNERIKVDSKEVSNSELAALWSETKPFTEKWNAGEKEKNSLFEAETALALKHFENKKCAYAVVECGMGGRLDATNALAPSVCVITRLSLDHTRELGSTVSEIAREKAAIIKRGALAAIAAESSGATALRVINARASREGVPLIVVGEGKRANVRVRRVKATPRGTFFELNGIFGEARLKTRLLGAHQAENAALAFTAAKVLQLENLRVTDETIGKGIARASWPGRLEIVSRAPHAPLVVFDGAHNPGAAKALALALQEIWPGRKWIIIFAAMRDKDYASVLKALAPLAKAIVATRVAASERSASAREIARAARRCCEKVLVEENAAAALEKARSLACSRGAGCGVLVCGSLYLLGELIRNRRNAF